MKVTNIIKKLADAAPANRKVLFETQTITAFDDIIDPNILRAVSTLDNEAVEELTELAQKTLLGKESSLLFVKRMGELVDSKVQTYLEIAIIEEIEASGVPFLFRTDLRGLNNVVLDREYNLSIKRRKNKDLSALDWATKPVSKGATDELTRLFGPNYRPLLRQFKHKRIVKKLEPADIAHYDKYVAKGIIDYGTLANANRKFGHLYEVDHLFEQRFWNSPHLVVAFDVHGQSFAFLVPKNAYIAHLLQKDVSQSVKRIKYVHTEKTSLLRKLIPNGKEHLFTVQQIWDAHIFTFDSLGFTLDKHGRDRLKHMFGVYIGGLKHGGKKVGKIDFHSKPLASQFKPGNWPVF